MKPNAYARDASRLRNLAQEVIRQVDFYRRNTEGGAKDAMRFTLMWTEILKMRNTVGRAVRRYERGREP